MAQAEPPAVGSAGNWFTRGGWYFFVTVLSVGWLAWIPFVHAGKHLHSRVMKRRAVVYGALAVVLTVLMVITPTDARGNTVDSTAGDAVSIVGALLMITIIVMGCVQQAEACRELSAGTSARRVYPGGVTRTARAEPPDPAVAAVMAARQRRERARQLVADDPLMARELRVGRPDIPHEYDDGGLVDLNSAPAATIAAVCEIDAATAQAIVTAREQRGGTFANIDEVFVVIELAPAGRRIDMSPSTWQVVRDRAVLVP